MGERIYWHNVTKQIWNENDLGDFVEGNIDHGDDIRFSIRGNAIIYSLNQLEQDEDYQEFKWVKDQFIEYFKEFYEEEFKV